MPASPSWLVFPMRLAMSNSKYFVYLIVCSVLLLACAARIMSAETLTLHIPGIEIKAEGSRPFPPQAHAER